MLSTVSLTNKAGATGKWQYSYDDNGNISQITTTVGTTAKTTQYFYDTAGQLVRENNEKAGTTTLWTYDAAGNILTEKVYAYTTGTPSTLQKTNTYTYTSTQWGDLLTAYNGNMIYYDGMTTLGSFKVGNPTTYNNGTAWTFTWEHGRQLATMTSGGTTWGYSLPNTQRTTIGRKSVRKALPERERPLQFNSESDRIRFWARSFTLYSFYLSIANPSWASKSICRYLATAICEQKPKNPCAAMTFWVWLPEFTPILRQRTKNRPPI